MDKQKKAVEKELEKIGISGLSGKNDLPGPVLSLDYYLDEKSGKFFIRYQKVIIEESGDAGVKFEILSVDKAGKVQERAQVMPELSLAERDAYFKTLKKIDKDEFFSKLKKRS
jgi:hypothetical protein